MEDNTRAVKQPLPRQIHLAIRSQLLDGTLRPGNRLDYKQIAKDMGVSTTPVREAVTQLASEGLVQLVPRLGAVVPSMTRAVAIELYEVREAVETFAALKAAERIHPRHLEQLKEQLETMERLCAKSSARTDRKLPPKELKQFLDADISFHQTILLGAKNPALARTVEESQVQCRIFFADRGVHTSERLSLACEQHQLILEALVRQDGKRASDAMRNHIRNSLDHAMEHLEGGLEA